MFCFWFLSLSWILNCLGAGGKFCGGFDINVFTKVHQTGKGMPFTCTVVSSMLGFLLMGSCLPVPLLTCATLVACRGCITYAGRIHRACVKHDGRYSFFLPHHLYAIVTFCICFCFYQYHNSWTHLFAESKKPSVAAIQGLALGGGLELTMVCHFCQMLSELIVKLAAEPSLNPFYP